MDKFFSVTVIVPDLQYEKHIPVIKAESEGKAKTRAIIDVLDGAGFKLNGAFVDYQVEELTITDDVLDHLTFNKYGVAQ
jgi:hypothetical protein